MAIKHVAKQHHHLLMDDEKCGQITLDWFDPDYWQRQHAVIGQAKGRGTTLFLQVGDEKWVLRHYRRGGLPGKILNDQYFFAGLEKTRPFKEFRLLTAMRANGLRVPEPLAVHVHRSGLIYRGDLITTMIPNSEDLHAQLCERALSKDTWHDVGVAVARMHLAGVYHHDLNVRNVMIDSSNEIWIIDFDRCDFRAGESWKPQNVARFLRSLEKEKNKNSQFHWQMSDWAAFLAGYQSA